VDRYPTSRTSTEAVKTLVRGADNRFVVTAVLLAALACVVIVGCLKGRYALSIIGLFVLAGIPAVLAAIRLARYDSWWARHLYDDHQLRRVADRYPGSSRIADALTL
jgi:hypothetical protein